MVADNPAFKRGGDGSIRAAKRDELAARAMEALLSNMSVKAGATGEEWRNIATAMAQVTYLIANAMLAEGGRQR